MLREDVGPLARPHEQSNWWLAGRVAVVFAGLMVLLALWLAPPEYVGVALLGALAVAVTLRYPVAGLCLLALAVPWSSGFALPVGAFPVTLTDLLVAALGAAWLAAAAVERRNPIVTSVWTPYVALFLGAIVLSTAQAADTHASLREIVKWAELAVVYLAAAFFMRSRRQVEIVVGAIVLAGVSQALLGYYQFAFAAGPAAFIEHRAFLRAYGTFDQPNPYAGFLNMTLPFALAMAALAPTARRRGWYRLALLLIAGAVLVSQSRGAALAGIAAVATVLSLMSNRLRAATWSVVLAGLAAAWMATLGLVPTSPFERILNAVGLGNVSFGSVTDANFSAVERAAHWLAGVRMFAAHPLLGVGIGNYGVVYPAFHPRGWYASLEHAHNYYINIAAEAGIVGLVCYLLLAGSALWYSYASLRGTSDPLYRAAILGVLGALVATDFHNLFDVLYVHGMVAFLGLIMALIAVSVRAATVGTWASNT